MDFLIIGIIAGVILTVVFTIWENLDFEIINEVAGVIAIICGVVTIALIIALGINGWYWRSSEYKKTLINREYHTSYTQEEVFYASDVIETIRQLDRTRIEINGNLLNKKE